MNGPLGATSGPEWAPVARSRTYELVLDAVETQIRTGAIGVGDRLPAERDLAAALGVSRAAVREAVRVLEARGVVRSGTGSGPDAGTVITALQSDALTSLIGLHVALNTVAVPDLVRARVALERESVALACHSATEDDLSELKGLLKEMDEREVSVEAFNRLDADFHIRIGAAGGNRLVLDLTDALRTVMKPHLLSALTLMADRPDELAATLDRLRREHHAIYEAIVERSPNEAAQLVEDHITGFYLSATSTSAAV
jgi:GntR family transcriptional repressor for pyruvate dehydrogenase complex